MSTYSSFLDLPLWKEAVDFAAEIYKFCETGKLKTDYRMKDQLRSAASSISNNIAEGFEYGNAKVFIRFLTYLKGSLSEVVNQFTILFKASMISENDYKYYSSKALELGKKIGGFIQYSKKAIKENVPIR